MSKFDTILGISEYDDVTPGRSDRVFGCGLRGFIGDLTNRRSCWGTETRLLLNPEGDYDTYHPIVNFHIGGSKTRLVFSTGAPQSEVKISEIISLIIRDHYDVVRDEVIDQTLWIMEGGHIVGFATGVMRNPNREPEDGLKHMVVLWHRCKA